MTFRREVDMLPSRTSNFFSQDVNVNLTYRTPELLSRPWFYEVDMGKYVSYFIAALNQDFSVEKILDPHQKIVDLLENFRNK